MDETKTSGLWFEEAMTWMRAGRKVARAGWIQPNKWVRIVVPEDPQGARYFEFKQGDGTLIPWTPTHNGLLEEDWYVVM